MYPTVKSSIRKLLVIRGIDDEASLALQVGAVNALLSKFVLTSLSTIIVWLALLVFIPVCAFVLAQIFSPNLALPDDVYYFLLRWLGLLFGVQVLMLLFTGVAKSSAGRELLFRSIFCDVAVNPEPDFSGDIEIKTLPTVLTNKRRHCLYDHPLCVQRIRQWILHPEYP
jgi:hypothetical protein